MTSVEQLRNDLEAISKIQVDLDTITAIANKIKAEECILFLGAGVHCAPPAASPYVYPESERPPLGGAFSKILAAKSGFLKDLPSDSPTNLQRVSMHYEKWGSRKQLVDEVRRAVDEGKKPSPALRALAKLNFPLVITTNYDQLFETALLQCGKKPQVVIYNPDEHSATTDYQDFSSERPFVFKIHGDISQPQTIVITDEDYIQFVLRMSDKETYHPIPETFRYHFKRWGTLFVGYSLLDYNLRLLFKTLRWKIDKSSFPDAYSIDLFPDPLILDEYQLQKRYIKFIAQDVWTVVPVLYEDVTGQPMVTV
jgi:SIR2-like domain